MLSRSRNPYVWTRTSGRTGEVLARAQVLAANLAQDTAPGDDWFTAGPEWHRELADLDLTEVTR